MRNDDQIAKRTAELLIKGDAVLFNFEKRWTFVSGIKSPIYCDCRSLISDIQIRNEIIAFIQQKIADIVSEKEDFIIAAVATGGIPYGSILADRMSKRMVYIRPEKKEHGKQAQIEGKCKRFDRAIVIEDHITTGESSLRAANALKTEQVRVLACISIMNYGFSRTIDNFQHSSINPVSLTDFDTLSSVALERGRVSPAEYQELTKWRMTVNRQLEEQDIHSQLAHAG